MVLLVTDPNVEERLIAERQAAGIDHHDEVWDGVYVVSPIANNEHQLLVSALTVAFASSAKGAVFPGANVSDREVDWTENYRVPDVAVFLEGNPAQDRNTHWFGGPDFAVEIVSSGDRSRQKLDFYARVGVRELLIVDRNPWALELYRLRSPALEPTGRSSIEQPAVLRSEVLPLQFALVPGAKRPQIEITHHDGRQRWLA